MIEDFDFDVRFVACHCSSVSSQQGNKIVFRWLISVAWYRPSSLHVRHRGGDVKARLFQCYPRIQSMTRKHPTCKLF